MIDTLSSWSLAILANAPNQPLSFWKLIGDASSFVIIIMLMLLFAVALVALLFGKKLVRFWRISRKCARFERHFWSGEDISGLFRELMNKNTEGLESLFVAGYSEFKHFGVEDLSSDAAIITNCRRAMDAATSRELDKQEEYLPLLASIGSTAPYVGLLGTVYGIMTSFMNLGAAKSVSINHVAPGIAEALIATAMGLLAAIPAVLAYNFFIARSERLSIRYEAFSEEFVNLLQRQIIKAKQM